VKRLTFLFAFALAATASAAPYESSGIADWTTPPAPTKEPTFKPPVAKRVRLPNGLAVLVVENHALPIVSMSLVVPTAGTAYDPKDKPGIAAFTADMLDEGVAGMTAIQIAQEEDRLGATITLGAGVDAARISVSTLTATLDSTIDLLAKIVSQPAFDPADFSRVAGDRATALELRRDRPREVASLVLAGALFGIDSAYGHPGAGVRESFKSISLADLKSFYAARWNPAAITLVVAGDVDSRKVVDKLNAVLGKWQAPGAKPARIKGTPSKPGARLQLVDRPNAPQSDVRIGIVGIDRKDARYYAFEVMANVLGGGFTSRLNQRLREQLGITYGIGAGMDWRLQPGPFSISSAIVAAETGHGIAEALAIVTDLAAKDVPAAELDKAKQNMIRALPAEFATNAETAAAFANLAMHGLPDTWFARYADQVRKVTAADVRAVAKAAIPSGKLVISVVGDMAKVRADLDKLGLGTAAMHDPYGNALP
jgi:zinc protease